MILSLIEFSIAPSIVSCSPRYLKLVTNSNSFFRSSIFGTPRGIKSWSSIHCVCRLVGRRCWELSMSSSYALLLTSLHITFVFSIEISMPNAVAIESKVITILCIARTEFENNTQSSAYNTSSRVNELFTAFFLFNRFWSKRSPAKL